MELWTTPIQSYTHRKQPSTTFSSHLDPFQHWEVCGINQDQRGTDEMSTQHFHQLQHGSQTRQPVFMKEVHGNVWKTGVINQPAKEPDSYWIKFPDSSILRRTRSMIKPRSVPSHFKLEAEGKEWNSSGHTLPYSHKPFNSNLSTLESTALPMDHPVPPALTGMATLPVIGNTPVSSTGASKPSTSSDPVGMEIPTTPR